MPSTWRIIKYEHFQLCSYGNQTSLVIADEASLTGYFLWWLCVCLCFLAYFLCLDYLPKLELHPIINYIGKHINYENYYKSFVVLCTIRHMLIWELLQVGTKDCEKKESICNSKGFGNSSWGAYEGGCSWRCRKIDIWRGFVFIFHEILVYCSCNFKFPLPSNVAWSSIFNRYIHY